MTTTPKLQQPGTGAVNRNTNTKLLEFVSVKDFGAVGDGVTDDIIAIRAAHVATKRVFYPNGHYKISGSISLYVQDVIGEDKERTFIEPTGNFPAFINDEAEFISGKLQNFLISYGETAPTVSGTDGLKVGIKFTGVTKWPTFYEIADVTVRGGWYAYYDDTGTYGSSLKRVFAWDCFGGFRKQNGTTMHFENCITQGVNNAFYIKDVLAPVLTACASDSAITTAGNYPNTFSGCMGLSINGWDSEGNSIVGDASALFFFELCTGTFNGFVGYTNTQASTGTDAVGLFRISNSQMSLGGIRTKFNGSALVFTGNGIVHTVQAISNAKVLIHGSNIDAASGGTPADRFSLAGTGGGEIKYISSSISGDVVGTSELADKQEGTWIPVPVSLTVTGGPTYSGKYSRVGKTVYASLAISANGGTTASTAGTTHFTGLPYAPDASAVVISSNSVGANLGTSLLNVSSSLYAPTWSASGADITISCTYKIA